MEAGYDINNLIQEARTRWLISAELLFILQNHQQSQQLQVTREPLQSPASGSLILVNKRVLKLFRNDGHNWRKKKGGKVVSEGHEKLKVGNSEVINCYYGHGEQSPNFQRRIYWRLDPEFEHIVLVHYRDVTSLNPSAGPVTESARASSSVSLNPSANPTPNPGVVSSISLIRSSDSIPNPVTSANVSLIPSSDTIPILGASSSVSLTPTSDTIPTPGTSSNYSLVPVSHTATSRDRGASSSASLVPFSNTRQSPGSSRNPNSIQDLGQVSQSLYNILGPGGINLDFLDRVSSPELFSAAASLMHELPLILGYNLGGTSEIPYQVSPLSLEDMEIEGFEDYSSGLMLQQEVLISLAEKQIFTIKDLSPECGNDDEETKVIIIGSFLCDPPESTALYCMFGDAEVPVDIILGGGIIVCRAPRHSPGKVPLYITCGNREACSEIREFDYRDNSNISTMYELFVLGAAMISTLFGDSISSPPSGGGPQLMEMEDDQ